MRIESSLFGPQVCESETQITFPNGIPGFEESRVFQLFHQDETAVVGYLQSVDDPDLTFSVLSPDSFNIYYEFTLSDEELALLHLEQVEDLVLLVIAYRNNIEEQKERLAGVGVNANFMAPLVVNAQSRIGFQKILGKAERKITIKSD
ncbi:MAG: flagellar assembly protein FliW [Sedimenticola sp.]|nr:flagellar assembly protein FliW [Sedimenticola sp.]MCW8949734.1 flagellar assembly protein FliW [Sedimenticola sp.]MCW8976640.1 flagellar assembly protein FliW [Sedimenticola sp.]MCW9022622.1 flagellar assembly protein FliW [Sedimenticola sp.]MDF1529387.1 flagellar assembly protein FliW [Sedimenticola sp.]